MCKCAWVRGYECVSMSWVWGGEVLHYYFISVVPHVQTKEVEEKNKAFWTVTLVSSLCSVSDLETETLLQLLIYCKSIAACKHSSIGLEFKTSCCNWDIRYIFNFPELHFFSSVTKIITSPNCCHVTDSDSGKWLVPLRGGAGILGRGLGEEPEAGSVSLHLGTSSNATLLPHLVKCPT